MSLKRKIQHLLAKWLREPIISVDNTTGFSLVRSEWFNTVLGSNTKVYEPFFLHNVELGNYSYIAKNSNVSNCVIGKFCSIGPNFCCGLGIHPTNGISTAPMFYSTAKQNGMTLSKENKVEESKQTVIGNDVFIGANVTVLDGVTIGNGAVIGAGAVVAKDIPPYAIAIGVPASVIKYRFTSQTVERLNAFEWWNQDEETLLRVEKLFWNVNEFLSEQEGKKLKQE